MYIFVVVLDFEHIVVGREYGHIDLTNLLYLLLQTIGIKSLSVLSPITMFLIQCHNRNTK